MMIDSETMGQILRENDDKGVALKKRIALAENLAVAVEHKCDSECDTYDGDCSVYSNGLAAALRAWREGK